MKIPTYLIGAIIFLVGQTATAIWWASSLSAEVDRVATVQSSFHGKQIEALEKDAQQCQIEIHNLKKVVDDQDAIQDAIKGLDVLRFQVAQISKELEQIRQTNRDIANQHGQLFDALKSAGPPQGPSQQKGGYGGYSYD
tara:strand:+ start:2975 stop:3391 length:417 start_codon:yes stop_codon:yes gene_type:complete